MHYVLHKRCLNKEIKTASMIRQQILFVCFFPRSRIKSSRKKKWRKSVYFILFIYFVTFSFRESILFFRVVQCCFTVYRNRTLLKRLQQKREVYVFNVYRNISLLIFRNIIHFLYHVKYY